MHIFFSGIGGTAIGPLAMIAREAGYTVSGSDKQDSQYVQYLRRHGIANITIGQEFDQITAVHANNPIDWFVYSSAVSMENPESPELRFCQENGIKTSKRDELLNQIIADKRLRLVAVAGTHGKTTTTAMAIWLFKQLAMPVSYAVGAKISFGAMGEFDASSKYFVYEADEFDRNFLAFHPYLSLITGIDWDHHEIYPKRRDYELAFIDFMRNGLRNMVWQSDSERIGIRAGSNITILNDNDSAMKKITLVGKVNRRNGWQVVNALNAITNKPKDELIALLNQFPGLNRRFERLADHLYSDYAHTEEKIRGCLQTAFEVSKNVVVVYEPLTNRRQYFIKDAYKNLFQDVKKLYWIPSYLAREDPNQAILSPSQLIAYMDNKDIAEPAVLDPALKQRIQSHLRTGDLVVCISGGGGGSLDEWLRINFVNSLWF